MSNLPHISVADLQQRLDQGSATLIDVREANEFAAFRVPKAELFPLSSFDGNAVAANLTAAGHDQAEPVYVLCLMGGRAMQAGAALAAEGLQPVIVAGGTQAWADAGYPLEAG